MWTLEIQIPFFWYLFIQFTRNACIKTLAVCKPTSPPLIPSSEQPSSLNFISFIVNLPLAGTLCSLFTVVPQQPKYRALYLPCPGRERSESDGHSRPVSQSRVHPPLESESPREFAKLQIPRTRGSNSGVGAVRLHLHTCSSWRLSLRTTALGPQSLPSWVPGGTTALNDSKGLTQGFLRWGWAEATTVGFPLKEVAPPSSLPSLTWLTARLQEDPSSPHCPPPHKQHASSSASDPYITEPSGVELRIICSGV